MSQTIQQLATKVVKELYAKGVHIHKYVSPAYGSTYLKFDYGAGYSLRIADHASKKKHLHYRFNLLLDCKKPYTDYSGKYPRHFYGPKHVKKLIEDVLGEIEMKKLAYGPTNYEQFMEQGKRRQEETTKGFWSRAVKISL